MADHDMKKFEELLAQNRQSEATVMYKRSIEELAKANAELEEVKKQLAELQMPNADVKGKQGESSHDVTIFSKGELAKATNNFGDSAKIGEGTYGTVYKGFLRHTHVAIKVLTSDSARQEKEFRQEVETLTKVRHPHLVSLIGASPEAHALVYDYLPNGSLENYLSTGKSNKKILPCQDRIRIASEICSALIFLHSQTIAHGNLKPENVLLDNNLGSKLTDFGLSRKLQASNETITPLHVTGRPRGSLAYIDPEFLAFGELTTHSDVFAFGIILLQLVTGKDPRGLRSFVEQQVESGKVDKFVDHSAGKWGNGEALKLAQLGLACSHQMRKRRADLKVDVWPVLEPLIKHEQKPKIESSSSGKVFKFWS